MPVLESIAEYLFWICVLLAIYTYFLYPLLLFVAYSLVQIARDWRYLRDRRNRRVFRPLPGDLPPVSVVIAAYNEQERLPEKLANLETIEYPAGKLEVVIVSDGSTDGTVEILRSVQDPRVRTFFLQKRRGKALALNHGIAQARFDIMIMSDAATMFAPDTVRKLVRHFAETSVGVVCGSLQFEGNGESRQTEGLYWKYESMLRLMEGRLDATLTASGALYAVRRECCLSLSANTLIEDFVVPTNARKLGYRVLYDPEAVATESAAPSVRAEFTRRARLAVGSFLALKELAAHAWRGFAGLAFFSHKLMRWIMPFLFIGMLTSNAFLWRLPFYRAALLVQLVFYIWAGVGFLFHHRMQQGRYVLVGYFLVAMNVAFLVGFFRFLAGRAEATWQRVN